MKEDNSSDMKIVKTYLMTQLSNLTDGIIFVKWNITECIVINNLTHNITQSNSMNIFDNVNTFHNAYGYQNVLFINSTVIELLLRRYTVEELDPIALGLILSKYIIGSILHMRNNPELIFDNINIRLLELFPTATIIFTNWEIKEPYPLISLIQKCDMANFVQIKYKHRTLIIQLNTSAIEYVCDKSPFNSMNIVTDSLSVYIIQFINYLINQRNAVTLENE